jgi:hypothetical protein
MQTLKVQIPEGFTFDSFDPISGLMKLKEKPKDVLYRILTDADVFADNGTTEEQFFKSCHGLEEDEIAVRFIKLLRKSLHEGKEWIPQDGEYRYEPRFLGGSSGVRCYGCDNWYSYSAVGSRLAFKKDVLAIHAGKHFTKWYKQAIYPQPKTV